jgi:magnesium and cobalt exporter, CNNM family
MEVFIIFGLIILNGIFAMAEIALVSARKARLEAQANKGDAKAKEALQLANHPDKFISTVQIGITLIGILNGIFSGESIKGNLVSFLKQFEFIRPYSNTAATIIIVIIITYFSLVLGELVPKRIGLSNPEAIAKTLAAPMRFVTYITYPFIWLLSISSNLIIKLFNIRKKEGQVTEEEIKAIISEGTEQGAIEEAEQQIIERVFHLGDRNITSLMTHRSDIVWLDLNSKINDIKKFTDDEVHSVYPVCDGNVDNVRGVISLKDIFSLPGETLIKDVMKRAFYVPENNSAYQLLEKFKQQKTHYAFIVDEYGTLQGIITLNDILEAIVGDISEPHEEDYEIVKRDDGSYLIDAQIPYYDFLSYFNKTHWMDEGEQEQFDTLAGFILHHLERIPVTGDKMVFRGFNFEIVDMDGHRIDKLLITLSDEVKEELEAE